MTIDARAEALGDFIIFGVCSSFVCELVQRTDKPKTPLGFGHAGRIQDVASIWTAASRNLLRLYQKLDPKDQNPAFLKARSFEVFKQEYCTRPYDLQDAERLIGKIIGIVADSHVATLHPALPQPRIAPRRYYGKGKQRFDAYTFCG